MDCNFYAPYVVSPLEAYRGSGAHSRLSRKRKYNVAFSSPTVGEGRSLAPGSVIKKDVLKRDTSTYWTRQSSDDRAVFLNVAP